MRRFSQNAVSSRSLPIESIASRILLLRGHKALLDADLADLYGVPTKVLVQAGCNLEVTSWGRVKKFS